jgi:Fe-S-cluster containining protein
MHPSSAPKGIPADIIKRARRLFSGMDREYQQVADVSGFVCSGCEDNCCRSLFYHHTYLELILLRKEFEGLSRGRQKKILERATAYVDTVLSGSRGTGAEGVMCPLNEAGRCALYSARPMICRLHGIPHELKPPGHRIIQGPGCRAFHRQNGNRPLQRLDRTPLYLQLARLEAELKKLLALNRKIKLTVAEMLLRHPGGAVAELISSIPTAEADHHETD